MQSNGSSVLVDCGLFQGVKRTRSRNWAPFPIPPKSVSSVVLAHAHLDHSGYVPALIRNGFVGKIWCTPGTADLLSLLWPDAGYLAEEEARYRNRHRLTRHAPDPPFRCSPPRRARRRCASCGPSTSGGASSPAATSRPGSAAPVTSSGRRRCTSATAHCRSASAETWVVPRIR
ncbi:MAG: MBL fold metallo-hydrolase [Proteobacteria bacterium]|nr:MBL fold metallo-hydrolase [Pseudomonadota bacterium]